VPLVLKIYEAKFDAISKRCDAVAPIMSFPRYPQYKDSGVQWLGEVPVHWETKPIKAVCQLFGRIGYRGYTTADIVNEGEGAITLSPSNMADGVVSVEKCTYISWEKYTESPEIMLQPGDIVMVKTGSTFGKVAYVSEVKLPTTINPQLVLFKGITCDSRFLFFILNADHIRALIDVNNTGSSIPTMTQESIGNFGFGLPPLPEQTQIAAFLDRETAKIDDLVAQQRRLMELLKEKRQAVISHAVTQGLNPQAPVKPSGIEWLGDVPAHWEVTKIKRLVATFEQGWSPQCEGFPVDSEKEWGVLKVGCVNGGVFRPEENKTFPSELEPIPSLGIAMGDLLISRANTRELVGGAAVAKQDYANLMLCDKLYRIRFSKLACAPQFIAFYLGTGMARGQIELAASGASSSMVNISQSTILEMELALPEYQEQQEIVDFLAIELSIFNSLITEAQRAIDLLQERRIALISAAVTGQIDVRKAI
jgi:type I restriction enzyme, S subunit